MTKIQTLDLHFLGKTGLIASYMLEHENGIVLIESGPGSTIDALVSGLSELGYKPSDITDLFLTHIHLDHAGAAGWLARQGAHVHVHHRGYPHLADPSKLMASATRIYGDQMDKLWGEILPVPADALTALEDGDRVDFGEFSITAMDTPGHANHHMVYVVDDICFSGDVGGIRLPGPLYVLMPMPAPEFHLERWQSSWEKLCELPVQKIAPTHFGIYDDAKAHLELLGQTLEHTAAWLSENMPGITLAELKLSLTDWMAERADRYGLSEADHQRYEMANPSKTSAGGILRYWQKYRIEEA